MPAELPHRRRKALLLTLGLIALAFGGNGNNARACTIFVLTDADHSLFFNNEDWSNPATHLWFVPAGPGYLGCAYVGFDDGWAQGGVNTAGLAYDWVAGAKETYVPAATLQRVRGNSSQRMLETCTTVDEAIAFYRAHRETEFARARILIADRSGASVIISAKAGALHFARETHSRGFGYGGHVLKEQLASAPAPTLAHGAAILRACVQTGATPTQYANAFNLKTGEIFVYPDPDRETAVALTLDAELAKGGHAYAIRNLATQLARPPRALRPEQKRFYLDELPPLLPAEPALAQQIKNILQTAARGAAQSADYTPKFWTKLAPVRADMQAQLASLGTLQDVTLVAPTAGAPHGTYRCIAEFTRARVLQRYDFDSAGKVADLATEFVELVRP